jgi:predicted ATPase
MIQNCSIEHFKSIYEPITLPLAPLTLFAGPNSSGKSTLIQSLLLMAQTIQNPVASRPVVLNGHILKLGEFDDILSNGATPAIRFGLKLRPPQIASYLTRTGMYAGHRSPIELIECDFSFSAPQHTDDDNDEPQRVLPRLLRSRIKTIALAEENQGQSETEVTVTLASASVPDRATRLGVPPERISATAAAALQYEVTVPPIASMHRFYGVPAGGKAVGAALSHFLPRTTLVVYDTVERQAEIVIQILTATGTDFYWSERSAADIPNDVADRIRPLILSLFEEIVADSQRQFTLPGAARGLARLEELAANFSFPAALRFISSLSTKDRRQLVSRIIEREPDVRRAVRGGRIAEYDFMFVPLPEVVDAGVDFLQQYFTRSVKYLGPLRDEPKPIYPLAGGADPRDIGYRGEHTAAVLETYRHTTITYFPTAVVADDMAPGSAVTTTLYAAVLDWLQYMGIADEVHTADRGKLGHELKVSAGLGEHVHDLTHVGVGVSQVLPILVLALLADPGSTLIFEQPELHLHPRVQTRLADFFVSMSRLSKQCLVETHSEYLINRLRYRAAVSQADAVSRDTLIYFVERHQGHSTYRPVRINTFGVVEDWPRGFFDESEMIAAEILRAGAAKRLAHRRAGDV